MNVSLKLGKVLCAASRLTPFPRFPRGGKNRGHLAPGFPNYTRFQTTVTVNSPTNITVTVEPGCEYGTLVLSGLAYDGSANSYLAPGGFTITVYRATP